MCNIQTNVSEDGFCLITKEIFPFLFAIKQVKPHHVTRCGRASIEDFIQRAAQRIERKQVFLAIQIQHLKSDYY